ncbi:MAG: hypothetical protein OXC00_00300 [Acidimicrobiaceae bacterium]|nr:hypothetical protein [Acidimicrobiaceae bacterium]
MGVFSKTLRLASIDGERSVEVEALVDTGSFYTLVPARLVRELEVAPFDPYTLELADGRLVDYDVGLAVATVDERTAPTLVLFGNDDIEPLLGAYTLEGLLLAVDPRNTRLVPLKLRMVSHPTV